MASLAPPDPAGAPRRSLDETVAKLHPPDLVAELGSRNLLVWQGLVLLALCIVAAVLRFYRIDAQSLWYDEGTSAYQLTRSYAGVVAAAAADTHPPLYYWAVKAWGSVFGATELGLRSLSAVAGVAGVALVWLMGRRLFGSAVAACSALLLALSPLAVYYGQELRMYTFVSALGLLAAWAYVRRLEWLYALAGIAAIYSQYLGATFLMAVNLHALLNWRSLGGKRGWLRWIAANAVIGLAFLPWLPTFIDQTLNRRLNTTPRTPGGLLTSTLGAYGGGVATGDIAVGVGAALVIAALLGVGLGWWKPALRAGAQLGLLLWLVPLAVVVALGLRNGLFESRYVLLGVPGLLLLAGLGVVQLSVTIARPKYSRLVRFQLALYLMAGLLVPQGDALARQYFDPALVRDDYRGVAATIQRESQPNDAIVLSAPTQIEVFSFYYHGPLAEFPLPLQRPIDEDDTQQRLQAIATQHQRVWLIDWALRDADPHGFIEQWLAQNGFQASHRWFGGVQLVLYTLASPNAPKERLDIGFSNGANLDNVQLSSRLLHPGDTLGLTLSWRAREPIAERWKVFTQVVDATPAVVAQRDSEPVSGFRPTTSWAPQETVEDNYGILLPESVKAGTYEVRIGMYQEAAGTRANVDSGDDYVSLGTIEVR